MKIDNHPTVLQHRATIPPARGPQPLDAEWIRALARECGADDAGLVAIDRPELDDQREEILSRHPWTKTLLAFVRRMSRKTVRSPARSIANLEFHHKGEAVNEIAFPRSGRACPTEPTTSRPTAMAVCPAGEDVIGPYLADRKRHLLEVVKPLQEKPETVYVVAGSDAEAHAKKRFKNKWVKHVGSGVRPSRVRGFLDSLPLAFQPETSHGLNARYHFTFTGDEEARATVVIAAGASWSSAREAGRDWSSWPRRRSAPASSS